MDVLPPLQNVTDAAQPAAMEPIHPAARTEAMPAQEPMNHFLWHGYHASAQGQDVAQTIVKPAGSVPVNGLHSVNWKNPQEMPPPPRPMEYTPSSHGLVNSERVGSMGNQGAYPHITRPAAPKLPAPVVISLPVNVDGVPVETQSFPISDPLRASATPGTRLIPSVVSVHEMSDCSTVANPWFVPTPGVIRNPLPSTYATPIEEFTSSAYRASACSAYRESDICPTTSRGNDANMPDCAVSTQLPAPVSTTSSLHAPEGIADAHVAGDSQEGQQDVMSDGHTAVASQEIAVTTSNGLDATSPETVTTWEEVDTPRDGSTPVQTRSEASPSSQTPESSEHGAALAPGLYGRERNKKRAATKAYRQPITPRALRSADSKKAAGCASSPTTTTKKTKRAAPVDEGPEKKRPKLSNVTASNRSRRATHPVDVGERKLRVFQQASIGQPEQPQTSLRPCRDVEGDRQYVARLQEVLQVQSKARKADMGRRQAVRINDLLDLAIYPSETEALFLTREEATEAVSMGKFFNGPIITEGQQALPLQTVSQFCEEYYDDDTVVWIQDPEIKPTMKAQIARQVKMGTVKERLAGPESDKPWNCLELATHSDDGLKPSFLNTEDCRLLTKLKIPDLQDKPEARRRAYLPGYKEVEKWALLAQAGALTEPHQDSHGYSTYITINQGHVGFGWLSFPSDEDRAAWRRNPAIFRGGNWRYVILKPGQTVYFPAGTVHFVFRLPSGGNTLAFGGHVLRCSNIVHWVKTLIEERNTKDVTNEDLTESAPGYLNRVEKFVKQARVSGQEAKWGGEESIQEFLRLKGEFFKRKQK